MSLVRTSKTLEKIAKEGKISRREFLKLAGTASAGIILGNCGKSPPTTPDLVIPVTYTGYIRGLINDSTISSGKIIFNHATEIPISNGNYTITAGHNLTEGVYYVRIETNEGIPREVSNAHLSNKELYVVKTDLPLDNVIEKNSIGINNYNDWLTPQGSERWLSNKPKFFLYDKSLWKAKPDLNGIEIINHNYAVDPATIANVEDVVKNDVPLYTNNFVNRVLHKESTHSERPDPNGSPQGWILYLVQDNAIYCITQSIDHNQGDIYSGMMRFQPVPIGRAGISIDTAQTLGIGQQNTPGQEILSGSYPSLKAQKYGKIIYNRAPHHNIIGGVDKEE